MSAAAGKKDFSHGDSTADWEQAHSLLSSGDNWRTLAFHGVMKNPLTGVLLLQFGCPACGTTVSQETDPGTVMSAVTNASRIVYRSLDIITTSFGGTGSDADSIPVPIDDDATARLNTKQLASHDALLNSTKSQETVESLGDGWFKCVCGKGKESGGFAPCDLDGYYCDPTSEDDWNGHIKCSYCHRFFHQDACKVLGFGPKEVPGEFEERRDAGILGHARLANIRRSIQTCQPDGGEVEIRSGDLFVRRRTGSPWERICDVGGHSIEVVGNGTVLLKRDGEIVLSVTP